MKNVLVTLIILILAISNLALVLRVIAGGSGEGEVVYSAGSGMPQIPFEVEHSGYGKTVKIVSGCGKLKGSVTLKFDSREASIAGAVFSAVDRAFDKPGVTKVQVCRVNNGVK